MVEKGQKIRARPFPPTPPFWAMSEKKTFFLQEVFPKHVAGVFTCVAATYTFCRDLITILWVSRFITGRGVNPIYYNIK